MFLGNDEGGRTAAILFSFTASCKKLSVEPWAYLRDVITRTAESSAATTTVLAALLPDVWLQAHPEARREYAR